MPTIITCRFVNAGMERIFTSLDGQGQPVDISINGKYSVFFDIINPKTANEQRFLRVVERATGVEKLNARLNDAGGAKPFSGNLQPNQPEIRTNLVPDVSCDIDLERIFFAEINLSADPRIEIRLCICPKNTVDDNKRFLSFRKTGIAILDIEDVDTDMDNTGGKKPLSGGGDLRIASSEPEHLNVEHESK